MNLCAAHVLASAGLLTDFLEWRAHTPGANDLFAAELPAHLVIMAEVLTELDDSEDAGAAAAMLNNAAGSVPGSGADYQQSLLVGPHAELAACLLDTILCGRRPESLKIITDAIAGGVSIGEIYLDVFQPLLREVGRLWQLSELSVAHEHYCTAAVQLLMGQLSAHVFDTDRIGHTVLTSCVGNELHEVGLRMVADFFEMAGWDSHFLGANVPAKDLLRMLHETDAEALCLSVSTATHIVTAREVISVVASAAPVSEVKFIIGGLPFNRHPDLWQRLGVDGYAANARDAVQLAERLVGI